MRRWPYAGCSLITETILDRSSSSEAFLFGLWYKLERAMPSFFARATLVCLVASIYSRAARIFFRTLLVEREPTNDLSQFLIFFPKLRHFKG